MNTIVEILDYEIRASWWAHLIGNDRIQDVAARYFAWKVRRKYARYERWKTTMDRINP